MIIMRSDFPALMVDGVKILFDESMEQGPLQMEQLYTMDGSDREFEVSLGLVGMGGTVPRKPEAEPIRWRAPQQGRPIVYVHNTFALGIMISLEAKEDDRSGKLARLLVPELARVMRETREEDGIALLNNAFTLMGYEPDGVSLISTAHPLVGGGTASNRHPTDAALSITSLGVMRALARKTLSESGRKIPLIMDTLFVPPDLETLAEELMQSINKPTGGALQGEKNVLQGKYGVRVLDRLSSTTAWFMRSSLGQKNFIWWNRIQPQTRSWDDPEADVLKFRVRARWSRGFNDWRGWSGSDGVP